MNCLALSQDSLRSKIPVIEYNGEMGLFLDSLNSNKMAHKLEEGDAAKKDLIYCDSSLYVCDSLCETLLIENKILKKDVELSEKQTKAAEDKSLFQEEKYILCDDQRLLARKQRWVFGSVGFLGGFTTGIVFGILLK